MSPKHILLNFVVLICLPGMVQAQFTEDDKLQYVEASIEAINSFNETLSNLTSASESEFESLFKRSVGGSKSAISNSAEFYSDLSITGMVQRNQKMISSQYYFDIYNKFYQRDSSATLNLRFLNWQLMINENDSTDARTAQARVLTSYNGKVKGEQPLSTIVLEFNLTFSQSAKTKAISCQIVSMNNGSEFMIENFSDEFAQKYLRRVAENESINAELKSLFSPLVESNCAYYNRAIDKHLQLADSLFKAQDFDQAKSILDLATSASKNYLTRTFYRTQRDNIDELLSQIEKSEGAQQQQRLDHFQLRLNTAQDLADHGENIDALIVLDELIAQNHELEETSRLRDKWNNEQQLIERIVEELEQGIRLFALDEFLTDSVSPHIQDYFKGVDFYENVIGEQSQRSHMLDQSLKALVASTDKNKDFIPSYAARIEVNKAIIAMRPVDKTPYIDGIYDDYEKLSSSSEHKVKFAREAYEYYEQENMHDAAVDMLSACWDMTRMDLAGMTNIALLLAEQHAFDGKANKAKKVFSELLEVDETLLKNSQFWEARLKTELITGTKESKEATIADFRSQFDSSKISATNNRLHDFFNSEGDKALAQDRYDLALKFYQGNQLIDPTLKDDLKLGNTANAVGQYLYAESIFLSSLTRNTNSDELYLAHANNLLDAGLGSYDIKKLEKLAYASSASLAENLTYLRALSSQDKKKAKAHLKHIKTSFSDLKNQQIYAKYLYLWYGKKDFDKATKSLEKYTSRTNTGEAYFNLACWYMGFNPCFERDFVMTKQANKNKTTAIKSFKESAEVNAPVSDWLLNRYLANIYLQEEDFKRSSKYFGLAIEQNQEDIESRMKKALVHFYEDEYDDCITALADISLLDFIEFCRQDGNYGKEVLGIRILIHIGADYLTQEDDQRSTKAIEEFRKMSEDNTSTTLGSDAPLSIANVAYWYILKKDEAKDENAELEQVLIKGLPEQWLNLDLFEKTEVFKALSKNSNFKQAWKER
ncbi:MAG: hypothetical protein ACI84C_001948 [Flavobacteriales bacterium]|jgi:hypothetical protein